MLDTNIVSFALRSRPPAVLARLRSVRPTQVVISGITLGELRFGAARSRSGRYGPMIDVFVSRVGVLPFDEPAAARYGEVRAELEARGARLGDLDMLIAGHALAAGCVLVTNNTREFGRVPELAVEDWAAEPGSD